MRAQVGRVHGREGALLGAYGGTDRSDDVRLGHDASKYLPGFRPNKNRTTFGQYEVTSLGPSVDMTEPTLGHEPATPETTPSPRRQFDAGRAGDDHVHGARPGPVPESLSRF
ncbi:hypothetical protein GCM10023195_36530 [Actinoallomurus liliacearum]|uniref:Uncharacterized protein n=1 Tax=Actinoallomurus liliacearum TaxID=1080073 RepID=A0ABP8TL00_9ACTN